MHIENVIEKMRNLKLFGMIEALRSQEGQKDINQLSFSERIGLLLEHEILSKEDRRLASLLRQAKLREAANIESIIYKAQRGLQKTKVLSLSTGKFIKNKQNLIITGATGTGKTYLGCAIGHSACRAGYKTLYIHLPRFIEELPIAHADGSYKKLMQQLQKNELLILDDFGLTPITARQCHDVFNIIEDRYQTRSTIITSQLPVGSWHDYLGEPTLADAILDRVLQNAERIELNGESMRKHQKTE